MKGCQLPSTTAGKLKVREQAHKQGQDEKCQALLWLSREEAGVQEEDSEQHFLPPRVWGKKLYLFIFKLITHSQPVLRRSWGYQQNSGSNLTIYLLPKQRMKSGLPYIPKNSKHRDWAVWHKRSHMTKSLLKYPQNLSAAGSQKVKDLSNGLMYFPFFHSLKAILSNLAAFYFQSINSSAEV